jgi:hypothetical protein
MRIVRAAVVAAFACLASPVFADEDAVRAAISAQLDAFRDGKPDAAYALAAPAIKKMFPTVDAFATMVRRGYAAVYDGGPPVFLRSKAVGEDSYAQEVALTDRAGKSWTALYTLSRQEDGSWRITGCYLKPLEGTSI